MRKQLTGLAAAMTAVAVQVTFAVAAVLGVLPVFSANVVYTEKPETEPIVVSGGTASIICQDAFANYLYAAWTFDDVNDRFRDVSGHGAVLEEGSLTAADAYSHFRAIALAAEGCATDRTRQPSASPRPRGTAAR